MTTNNWKMDFDNLFTFNGKNPEMNLGMTFQLHAGVRKFIEDTLESQRQQIVQEIQGLIPVKAESTGGKVYAEASKQAWEMAIKEVLSLPSLQVNKDNQIKSSGIA